MRALRTGLLLPIVFVALGQTDDLAERLRRAFPQLQQSELAAQHLKNREFLALEGMLEKSAANDQPARLELLSLEGAVTFLAGDMPRAVSHFRKAAECGVLGDRDAFTQAMALVALGEHRQASDVIASLAGKHPKHALYLYWQGRLDYDLRLYPEAIEKLQKVTELDPGSARAWDALGLAFDMEGTSDRAYQCFQKAAELNRRLTHPSAWPPHSLGTWYLRANQFEQAEQAFKESLQYNPDFAQAHYHLARTLEKEGREQQAILEYKTAIATDKSSDDACYSLATLYRKLDRGEEASAMFAEYRKRRELNHETGLPATQKQQ